MTVAELRKILELLPDHMVVAARDVGGHISWEFFNVEVIDAGDSDHRGPDPGQSYLEIDSA